jgi:nucleoside-diphosphate-sugar epimerase
VNTRLISGVTGFLGSSLAAVSLAKGDAVVALSRNDADGQRTRAAVLDAARGFALPVGHDLLSRLTVVEVDYRDLGGSLGPARHAPNDDVWHAAAEMSYSVAKTQESFRQNVVATTELYDLVRERAPRCARFHYVSTAYTAGMEGGRVAETLHYRPTLANAYQISKWSAEQALANRSRGSLPVTLFRPTAIIGHGRTGWALGKGFGYYMFIRAFWEAARKGVKKITFDVNPDARFDGIAIDDVVAAARAFAERPRAQAPGELEIVHASNPYKLSTREHFGLMGQAVGVAVDFGAPKTPFDRAIDEVIAINRGFASGTWDFETTNLGRVVGDAHCREPLGPAALTRIIRAAVTALDEERDRSRSSAA